MKALAIRPKKLHIAGSPRLKIEATPVHLDVEDLPDRDFEYPIGVRIGGGEVIGGSQREERFDVLQENMRYHKLRRRTTGGIWTCAAMAPCPTPGSDWVSSGSSCS